MRAHITTQRCLLLGGLTLLAPAAGAQETNVVTGTATYRERMRPRMSSEVRGWKSRASPCRFSIQYDLP
jgi:hypothetical protein